jgi:hypothetical protein
MIKKVLKIHKTLENAHETVRNGHGTVMQTVRNGEHLGTFESKRSNALERIVDNVHVHVSKTKETLYLSVNSIIVNSGAEYNLFSLKSNW